MTGPRSQDRTDPKTPHPVPRARPGLRFPSSGSGHPVSRRDTRSAVADPSSCRRAAPKGGVLAFFLRKEVIQPQVPLRLPCYDFTPVADLTVAGCLLEG